VQDLTDESTALRRAFEEHDRDGDGRIAYAEFQALLRTLDQDLSDDECLLAFELVDADGSGTISFDEFKAWWTDQ
jgi:Ca2+-binding EF-hand superfamily protein